ncbi:pyridoxal phosphate-dependent aminotransferase [Enterococcus devriesei]|uniref:MalY/PatB family protein n=1 Tax=Enterococcus devriesei TaxID=319970 RepID=UPI001C1105A5|nr:MalY/PatB family protein [Enterococcus devriesei]MBU5364175.1 pyridoxal phosphate-dependent aminotransferase [Enterococcus devriesei]
MEIDQFINDYAIERKQTNSLKWDALDERYGDSELLPLWVADTEFKTPKPVIAALETRIRHGIFGYSIVPDDYFEAYEGWQKRHEKTPFQANWLSFSTGVVQSLYDLVACFTEVGDSILIQPPVYYPFFNAIKDQKRKLVTSELIQKDSHYQMDLVDFENKLLTEQVKVFILCSPHNPVGRVWSEEELRRVLTLCNQYGVLVIADEIHSDLVFKPFTSTITVAEAASLENLIVCNAPSKTFNLASLLTSHVWIPNVEKRKQYSAWSQARRQTENSSLGQLAAKTAYETGDDWLQGLLSVVEYNYTLAKKKLTKNLPQIRISELEGTYLLWLDLTALIPASEVKEFVQEQARLAVDYGEWFSATAKSFIRLNLATSPLNIQIACDRLIAAMKGR